jgi:hypothetical protein
VKVKVPPGSTVTVVTMSPVPLVAATLEPGEATAVQLAAVISGGKRSSTNWSTAVLEPVLLTTMVYLVLPPGIAASIPSVLVMDRSAWGVSASVSMALSLPGVGSVTPSGGATVAVLTRVPVAEGSTWTVKRKVTLALTGRLTVVARSPAPSAGPMTVPPPLLAVADQVAEVTPSGSRSDTLAPATALGPVLLTTMV